ncbi:Protein CBG27600 [Caenorhabditis briggsae]|uniref:Protein CBG27600 n=1 Tax=Caenorhabditis briggsae TaxID=6238 RepID=B6IKH0_CAEBR|nr:Protein CBG27600 [Caenorhabditis briggsae]CAS00400.1 Protein CBG27600 [Caenorhabditis briggsae]
MPATDTPRESAVSTHTLPALPFSISTILQGPQTVQEPMKNIKELTKATQMTVDQVQKQFKSNHLIHSIENLLAPRTMVRNTNFSRRSFSPPLPIPIEDVRKEAFDPEYLDHLEDQSVKGSVVTIENSNQLRHSIVNLLAPRINVTVPNSSACRIKFSGSQHHSQSFANSFSTHNSIPLPIPIEDIKQESVDPEYPDYMDYEYVRNSENTFEKFEGTPDTQCKHHNSYKELVESGDARIRRNTMDALLSDYDVNTNGRRFEYRMDGTESCENHVGHIETEASLQVFDSDVNNPRSASSSSSSTLKSYSYYASDEEMGSASDAESQDYSIFGRPTSKSTILGLPSPVASEDFRSVFSDDDFHMDFEVKEEPSWEVKEEPSTDEELIDGSYFCQSIANALLSFPVVLDSIKQKVDDPKYSDVSFQKINTDSEVTMKNLGDESCLDTITCASHKGSISQKDKPSSRSSSSSNHIVIPLPVALADIKQEIIDPDYPDEQYNKSVYESKMTMESKDLNGRGQLGESSENGNQSDVYTHGLFSALQSPVSSANPNTNDYEAAPNTRLGQDASAEAPSL